MVNVGQKFNWTLQKISSLDYVSHEGKKTTSWEMMLYRGAPNVFNLELGTFC